MAKLSALDMRHLFDPLVVHVLQEAELQLTH